MTTIQVSCPACARTVTVKARISSIKLTDIYANAPGTTLRISFKKFIVNHRCDSFLHFNSHKVSGYV